MFEENLKLFKNQFEILKGQLVLCCGRVYRLIALSEDEFDFYWILFDGKKTHLVSCCIRITQLKNKIDCYAYEDMIRVAKLNDIDLVNDIDKDLIRINLLKNLDVKLISEVNWQIN